MKQFYAIVITIILLAGTVHADNSLNTGRKRKISARIVGGEEADPGAWPWITALVKAHINSLFSGHYCGGTLIHSKWVVTAAHCTEVTNCNYMTPEDVDVVLGVHDLKTDIGERIKVKTIIRHPSYDCVTLDSDIALLELERNVSYPAIQLASGENTFEGKVAIVMGWGSTIGRGGYAEKLQQVTVPVVSNWTCRNAFSFDEITDNMMCAGYSEGGKDACQGDSGGPLIVSDSDIWKLAGIISWGEGCADPDYYGVYTRISNFDFEWIGNYVPLYLDGDFNLDKTIDIFDALGISMHIAGIFNISDPDHLALLDVDEDGEVTIFDALAIAKYDVRLPCNCVLDSDQ
ncbi:MAG: trypsin-like serine protease [Desulfobacterales bacterium]|nr:trypsin-like serine protease [Desulfobacterales bacterium]